jgi:hypothetical protein
MIQGFEVEATTLWNRLFAEAVHDDPLLQMQGVAHAETGH